MEEPAGDKKPSQDPADHDVFYSLRSSLEKFSDDSSLSKQDILKKVDEIHDWVEEQKKSSKDISVKENVENVCKIATATTNAILKFETGNTADVVSGTMDIVASVAVCVGATAGPIGEAVGAVIGTVCSIIGAIFMAMKPRGPSVLEQLAEVVHKELVGFNKKLQDQKYNGLKDRVTEQNVQLRTIKPGEELFDPNLWNDYVQFLGELSNRFESPLPFKYGDNLTKDPDVADFVTAVATFCQAYNCFMALLIAAKGKFTDLKEEKYVKMADLKITTQRNAAEEKLAFLSEKTYLSFLGRLPYEGGKLTKILALSRNSEAKSKVEMVTRGLGLPNMPDLEIVEIMAKEVSWQSVIQPEHTWPVHPWAVQFINKTKFPMKVVCEAVGKRPYDLKPFTEVVKPDSSITKKAAGSFSADGYILLYLDGTVRSDDYPHGADETRVMEFAMSFPNTCKGSGKINIQDKTGSEFAIEGHDTYDKMKDGKTKAIYWMINNTHHMACAETFSKPNHSWYVQWRFIVREFDPFSDVFPQAPPLPTTLSS